MTEAGKSGVKTAYTKNQSDEYDEIRFLSKSGAEIHAMELARVMGFLSRVDKEARVVEVGCGTGRLLIECLKRGYKVDGMDASSNMLDELRDKLQDLDFKTQLDIGDAAKLPYEDQAYDAAYSVRLLNQTESPSYALSIVREMVRIVRPGGHVLVECVNVKRPRWGRNKALTTRLSISNLSREGQKAGATVIKTEGAFFLGMGAYSKLGDAGVPIISAVDRLLARIFPNYCSRIYVMLKV